MTTKDKAAAMGADEGVEVNYDLLSSFTIVNVGLANDPEVIEAIERRVTQVENHREVDLAEALSRPKNLDVVDNANSEAIRSILHEMGLQQG